mmetsp:Transcript_12364/g.35359  ORF Transcript_12364/g.35359 Transcript_12364/m.35359 type:complete len:143 (+) Transcript_12364:3005-3433(+)
MCLGFILSTSYVEGSKLASLPLNSFNFILHYHQTSSSIITNMAERICSIYEIERKDCTKTGYRGGAYLSMVPSTQTSVQSNLQRQMIRIARNQYCGIDPKATDRGNDDAQTWYRYVLLFSCAYSLNWEIDVMVLLGYIQSHT